MCHILKFHVHFEIGTFKKSREQTSQDNKLRKDTRIFFFFFLIWDLNICYFIIYAWAGIIKFSICNQRKEILTHFWVLSNYFFSLTPLPSENFKHPVIFQVSFMRRFNRYQNGLALFTWTFCWNVLISSWYMLEVDNKNGTYYLSWLSKNTYFQVFERQMHFAVT